MGELKANDQILRTAEPLLMRPNEDFSQLGEIALVFVAYDELVGISTTVCTNSHRLTAINQFGAAFAETLPSPANFLGGPSRGSSIPAFHRMNGPAIADAFAIDKHLGHRFTKRRVLL